MTFGRSFFGTMALTRAASRNPHFPEHPWLYLLPWLPILEAAGLVFYDLLEAAHLMFPLMSPEPAFLSAMAIPSVGTMYSALWIGHAAADGVLAWVWYNAVSKKEDMRTPMLQAALWDATWAFFLIPWLVSVGCWAPLYGLVIGTGAGGIALTSLYIALAKPSVLSGTPLR